MITKTKTFLGLFVSVVAVGIFLSYLPDLTQKESDDDERRSVQVIVNSDTGRIETVTVTIDAPGVKTYPDVTEHLGRRFDFVYGPFKPPVTVDVVVTVLLPINFTGKEHANCLILINGYKRGPNAAHEVKISSEPTTTLHCSAQY